MGNVSDLGSFDINFIEIYDGSNREINVTRKNISKKFVFVIESDRFVNEAQELVVPGTNAKYLTDDDLVHRTLMEVFWSETPMTYVYWLSNSSAVMLFASNMTVKQLSWCRWRVEVDYDIPDDNGSNTAGGASSGNTGPSAGEVNSQRYTQVSFNASVGTQRIQRGYLIAVDKATSLPAGEAVPWTINRWYPIGVSEEEISGAEVYSREFRFQITQYLPPTRFTYQYVRRLSRLITCVNSQPFFGFAPGSVMFVGHSGESDLFEAVPLTLEFEVKPNFKFLDQDITVPADPNDQFTYPAGVPTVDYSNQYDQIGDPGFPDSTGAIVAGMAPGVFSGWCIVDYRYLTKIVANSIGGVVRQPSHRLVYGYYPFQDFSEFLL